MKRYSRMLLTALIVLTFCGQGCHFIWSFLTFKIAYMAMGNLWGPIEHGDGFEQVPYGISVGEIGSIYTQEGGPGYPWIESTSPTSENLNYVKIYNDSTVAFAAGNNGTVIRSLDNGHSWEDLSIPSVTTNLHGLDFLDYWQVGLFVVVCGDNGSVYSSTDSGGNWTWQQLNTPTTRNLKSICAITTDIFIAVGEGGTIIRTSDSGQTWDDLVTKTSAHFNRVLISTFYPNFNRAWAVGDGGTIYASTDYGSSWFPQNSGSTNDLYDLSFRNSDEGIVAGENGTVKYTTDGGSTWLEDPDLGGLTTNHIISIASVDTNTASALVVSSLGGEAALADTTFVLTVSSEPIVGIGAEHDNVLPATFEIFQNYPNPFNPSTTIKYQLGDLMRVRLSIFDIRGRRVLSLVDEEQENGVFQVHWNGRNELGQAVPSGVYFYRLDAGEYSSTRKMVLTR